VTIPEHWLLSLLIVILAFHPSIRADGLADPCKNMYQYACTPGERDDGTGVADIGEATVTAQRVAPVDTALSKKIYQLFFETFTDPKQVYFRQTAMSVFSMDKDKKCNSKDKESLDICARELSKKSLPVFLKAFYPMSKDEQIEKFKEMYNGISVKDLDFFVSSAQFTKIARTIRKPIFAKVDEKVGALSVKIETSIFPDLKFAIIDQVRNYVQDRSVAEMLVNKINSIEFEGSDCGSLNETFTANLSQTMRANAFYDLMSNSFLYCKGALLQSSSIFSIVFVLGHELSHSIDPCSIGLGPKAYRFNYSGKHISRKQAEAEYPFGGLLQCLRSDQSVNAQSTDDLFFLNRWFKSNSSMKYDSFDKFCSDDQIGESFADWMAAELLAKYVSKNLANLTTEQMRIGFGNSMRALCQDSPHKKAWNDIEAHPKTEDRINKILMANPNVIKLLKCEKTEGYKYCTPKRLQGPGKSDKNKGIK
jgi:hypothetical protein